MKNTFFLTFLLLVLFVVACKPQNEVISQDNEQKLTFSEDAIVFDTIFAGQRTATRRLRVYNPTKKAFKISEIRLGGQAISPYKIIVGGDKGTNFNNIDIFGGDSLLILVEANVPEASIGDIKLAYDSIMFRTSQNTQKVRLLAWSQKVNIITGNIACNTIWNSPNPYILKDSVFINENCNLEIKENVRVFAFNNAILKVKGNLKISGTAEKPVKISYFRQEEDYQHTLGQWKGIFFYPTSQNNQINYATIKNAQIGLSVNNTRLSVNQTTIESMSIAGISAENAVVTLNNCLITNCIERLFKGNFGGRYELNHCTLANYEFNFNRDGNEGLAFINQEDAPRMEISLFNCIFWGNLQEEVLFLPTNSADFSLFAGYNIFKTTAYENILSDNSFNNQLNVDADADSLFKNPSNFNFKLPITSPARTKGVSSSVLIDILGKTRANPPSIGSYE